MTTKPGKFYLVGTPIGNLEDITLRALRVLAEVTVIAAEDTRTTANLLRHYEINTPLLSYHQHSSDNRRRKLLELLKNGQSVALVSEAGMPGLSDPGADLVMACAVEGIPVTVIPGPTASSAALAVSGLLSREFSFLGFLPARPGERLKALSDIADRRGALVCYEAPHRIRESLEDMKKVLGDRTACCARELTKRFEEILRGTLSELLEHFTRVEPRGEFTLVVEGAARVQGPDLEQAIEEVAKLVAAGLSKSRAVAHVAEQRGLSRNKLYRASLHRIGERI